MKRSMKCWSMGWSVCWVVGAFLGGAFGSAAMAQDLEREAAAEVRRREAAAGVDRGGLDASLAVRQRKEVAVDEQRGPGAVARAVNGELTDVARALRRLDQSYAIRGFQGRGAWTAGSVYVDWRAKGVKPQDRVVVLPPDPIVLGRPKVAACCPPCSSCGQMHYGTEDCLCGNAFLYARPAQPKPPCCDVVPSPTPLLQPIPVPNEAVPPAPAPTPLR